MLLYVALVRGRQAKELRWAAANLRKGFSGLPSNANLHLVDWLGHVAASRPPVVFLQACGLPVVSLCHMT